MKRKSAIFGILAASMGAIAAQSFGGVLVSDDFSGTDGVNLNGQSPDIGTGTWVNPFGEPAKSTQFFEYTGSGSLERSINNGAESRIAFTAGADEIVTITAEMTPIYGTGWSGVAFTADQTTSWYAGTTVVAGRIQNNDFFMGNSADFNAHSGTIAGFSWDQTYSLELSYNQSTEEARFRVLDEGTVVGDTGWQGSFAGDANNAAFSIRNPQDVSDPPVQNVAPSVTSFEVSSIPESENMGAMIAIFAFTAFVWRRNSASRR